jgi:hypothetical protein
MMLTNTKRVIPAKAGTQCASVHERERVIQGADAPWLGSLSSRFALAGNDNLWMTSEEKNSH